jgi:hypothetical protein
LNLRSDETVRTATFSRLRVLVAGGIEPHGATLGVVVIEVKSSVQRVLDDLARTKSLGA